MSTWNDLSHSWCQLQHIFNIGTTLPTALYNLFSDVLNGRWTQISKTALCSDVDQDWEWSGIKSCCVLGVECDFSSDVSVCFPLVELSNHLRNRWWLHFEGYAPCASILLAFILLLNKNLIISIFNTSEFASIKVTTLPGYDQCNFFISQMHFMLYFIDDFIPFLLFLCGWSLPARTFSHNPSTSPPASPRRGTPVSKGESHNQTPIQLVQPEPCHVASMHACIRHGIEREPMGPAPPTQEGRGSNCK